MDTSKPTSGESLEVMTLFARSGNTVSAGVSRTSSWYQPSSAFSRINDSNRPARLDEDPLPLKACRPMKWRGIRKLYAALDGFVNPVVGRRYYCISGAI